MKNLKKLLVSNKEANKIIKSQQEYTPNKDIFCIGMTKKEMKVLLFWANVGIKKAKGGSYYSLARKMVDYFITNLKIKL